MSSSTPDEQSSPSSVYGEGFSAVYTTSRYAVFSQRLAKLALSLIEKYRAPGTRLLDLACGAGAGTAVLSRAGFEVTGVDQSPVMLRYARDLAHSRGLSIDFQPGAMESFVVEGKFDVVTCLFDALNYLLTEQALSAAFARVAGALRPEGLFVFDMNTVHGLATRWGTKDVVSTNRPNLFEVNQNRFDADTEINTTTTTVFVRKEGSELFQRFTEVHCERGYPIPLLLNLLETAEFETIAALGLSEGYVGVSEGLAPLTPEAGRVVVVARRR